MSESLDSSGTNMARMITFLRAHKRLATFSLVAFGAFWLAPSWSEVGPFGFLFFFALFVMLIVSQIFWVGRVVDLGERFIPGKPRRAWLTAIASVVCLFFFAYNIGLYISPWKIPRADSTHLSLRHVLFEAPFWWWFVGSWAGFALVLVFWALDRVGRAAAWACRKARNAELYAICDVAEDLLNKMAAVHAPHVAYRDYDQMLTDSQVEAVLIATADQFHVSSCLKAIAAGKHVLVEKPLGVTVEECEELRNRLSETKMVLQLGNNRRFDPGMTFAHRFIQEEIGELMALKAWYCDSTYRYTMTDNLQPIPVISQQARRPEGNPKADKRRYFMLTHGSHLVDTARFLAGEITAVRVRSVEKLGTFCWFVEADLANGALAHIELTIPVRGDFEEGFRIYGEHGSIQGKVFLPWFHKSSDVECFSVKERQFHRPLGEDAYTYKLQIENFADAILHGHPQHGAGIDDGVAGMRALVAIARSADSGEKIKLSEVEGGV